MENTQSYTHMEINEFLSYYHALTQDANKQQDATKFCVTFIMTGSQIIAEIWRTEKRAIMLPVYGRFLLEGVPLVSAQLDKDVS